MSKSSETYQKDCRCFNCGWKDEVDIPKGILVSLFIARKECPNCGCLTLYTSLWDW